MSRRIEIDGRFYRIRRGKKVEIPPFWVGRVFPTFWDRYKHPRPSKGIRKLRMSDNREFGEGHAGHHAPRHAGQRFREDEEIKEFERGDNPSMDDLLLEDLRAYEQEVEMLHDRDIAEARRDFLEWKDQGDAWMDDPVDDYDPWDDWNGEDLFRD